MHDMLQTQKKAGKATSVIEVDGVDFCYGSSRVLKGIDLVVPPREIVAFIGPSGCGKSTLLRCFNRMNDLVPGARVTKGTIHVNGS